MTSTIQSGPLRQTDRIHQGGQPVQGLLHPAYTPPSPPQSKPQTAPHKPGRTPLYTADERVRRDATVWTLVQGILAPVQFLIFLISLGLVSRFLLTGEGQGAATASVVIKTLALYAIMVTGCIWEKVVFGRYLFAPAFYWEDVFSMLVLALHTAYLLALAGGWLDTQSLMLLALAAYAAYMINAVQFILKLRAARLGGSMPEVGATA